MGDNSKKAKKAKEEEVRFDIKSFEPSEDTDTLGFRSEAEEMPKAAEKKLKKEIQVTTPGLKKSIKKFEDFSLEIEISPEGGEEEYDPYSYSGCGCCPVCTGESDCECGCPECNCPADDEEFCDSCDCAPCKCGDAVTQTSVGDEVARFSNFEGEDLSISESLKYHIKNSKPVTESIFRPGSEAFFELLKETRNEFNSVKYRLPEVDRELFESTEIGEFAMFKGRMVPLDLPMEYIEEITEEAEYKGREVKLNYPMRGGTKKYQVYVRNPKTGKVKKIAFGDVHGGLTAKVSDPDARKNFASRHKCSTKKDKTKAGYWACRINKYGHLWGGKTYPGYW
jgi:hypothetical protein